MNFIKKNKAYIAYFILLILYGFFISLRSPYSPGAITTAGKDSSVFVYIADGWSKGLIPYANMFDHKGIIIYLIDMIGLVLFNGSTIGIWFMEMVFTYINMFVIWKICKIFNKKNIIAFFTTVITYLPYIIYYSGGNRVEQWALTFILLALYAFLKHLNNRTEIKKSNLVLGGITTSCILWCKPNLIIVDIVFILVILIDLLIRKEYKDILKCIIWFCVGLGIISLPIVIYLICNNAFKHCINSYLLFNFKYVGDEGAFINVLKDAINYWSLTILSSLSFVSCVLGIQKSKKNSNEHIISIASILFLLMSFIIVSISGRNHPFYATVCIACFVYPTYNLVNYYFKNKKIEIKTITVFLLIISIIFCNEINQLHTLVSNAHNKEKNIEYSIEKAAQYITENTEIKDEVIVLGNNTQINILSKRRNSAKYFYQDPIADIDENIANEFLSWLKSSKPKVMVLALNKSTKNRSYYRKELFEYLEEVENKKEYKVKKIEDIFIYEKVEKEEK